MESYNKKSLVDAVALELGATKKSVTEVVDAVFNEIKNALGSGEDVFIYQFGKFEKIIKPERNARNPRTGEPIVVPQHAVIKFKPAKDFKDAVVE